MKAVIESADHEKKFVYLRYTPSRLQLETRIDWFRFQLKVISRPSLRPFLDHICKMEKTGEVIEPTAAIVLYVRTTETTLCYHVFYQLKTLIAKGEYKLQEKEMVFPIQASQDEIIQIADRYIEPLQNSRYKSDRQIWKFYHEWAHPLTLEEVTERLNPKQRREAAKILAAAFPA